MAEHIKGIIELTFLYSYRPIKLQLGINNKCVKWWGVRCHYCGSYILTFPAAPPSCGRMDEHNMNRVLIDTRADNDDDSSSGGGSSYRSSRRK